MDQQIEERAVEALVAFTTEEFLTDKSHYTTLDVPERKNYSKNRRLCAQQADIHQCTDATTEVMPRGKARQLLRPGRERETDLNDSRWVRFNFKLKDRNYLLLKAISNHAYCKCLTENSHRACNPQCNRQRPQRHRQNEE